MSSLRILSLPSNALCAAAEALLLTLAFPQWLPDENAFAWAFIRLLGVHFAFMVTYYFLFLGLIEPRLLSPLRQFPRAKGKQRTFRNLRPFQGDQFVDWLTKTDNEGVILLWRPFFKNRLVLTHPRALADVLVHNTYDYEKPKEIRIFLRNVLGDGLIIVEGDEHRFQRKRVMPAFSFRHIKELYPMMWRKSLAMVERINAEILETDAIEMTSWASKATLDIIGVAGLGRDFNAMVNSDDELVKCYEELLEPTLEKGLFFLVNTFGPRRLIRLLPWRLNRIFEETTQMLRVICRRLLLEKRELIKANADDHFDILSLLVKSGDFADDGIVDQLLTFLAAGHETTSSAFTWLAYLLATHPDAQRRIREEVRQALPVDPAKDPAVDIAKVLEGLPYLNGVCNETLRLFPTVPITVRIPKCDTTIIGRPVPQGTEIVIPLWAINRNPKLWGPDAADFKPERWIDVDADGNRKPNNSGGADSNYSLMTFMHGPRSCIGQNFAKAELRCLVAAFAKAFEWEMVDPAEEIVPAGAITIKPKSGLHLRLKPLGGW